MADPTGTDQLSEARADAAAGEAVAPHEPPAIPLDEPAEGVPQVVESERELMLAAEAIAAGEGPVALDAERASGYRYGQRAYLVQVRRDGSGTWLVDPIACPDLTPLDHAIGGAEWILHAATQDLACLADVGLRPRQLFDTELAARVLGLPRVGLAAVVEHYLGLALAKEHSAVDWSTRPLPESWLRYAALDVEVLGELRNLMGVDLATQGKAQWAREEFEALLTWEPNERADPWRRLAGLHTLKSRRLLGVARELWYARDDIAKERDISPGRVIPDRVLVEIAAATPRSPGDLPMASNRAVGRHQRHWLRAVTRGLDVPEDDLPPRTVRSDGPPPPRAWADRAPVAAARLAAVKEALAAFGEEHSIPVENLCTPDTVRRVLWSPPSEPDEAAFAARLSELGARPWQVEIVSPMLAAACAAHPGSD